MSQTINTVKAFFSAFGEVWEEYLPLFMFFMPISKSMFFIFLLIAVSGLPEYCTIFHFPPPFVRPSVTGVTGVTFLDNLIFQTMKTINFEYISFRLIILEPSSAYNSPLHSRTALYSPEHPSTVKNSLLHPSTAHYSLEQPSATQYNSPV